MYYKRKMKKKKKRENQYYFIEFWKKSESGQLIREAAEKKFLH